MKLSLLTAIWGRPRLTEMFLDYYNGVDSLDLRVGVISNDQDAIDPTTRWWSTDHANNPLSDKWQHGIENVGADGDMDAVIIAGSDDFLTPQYIEACRYLIERGADLIQLDGAYFLNAETGDMIWSNAISMGMGRCISRRLLDRLDWQLWPEGLNQGLDGAMMQRIHELDGVNIVKLKAGKRHGIVGLDVKTGENIWSFDHVKENTISYRVKTEEVLRRHFPSIADELLNWNEKEVVNA